MLIPYMEYTHNTYQHLATKKSPFELLHKYQPRAYPAIIGNTDVPTTDACLEALQCARKEAQASLKIAAEAIRIQHDYFGTKLPPFKKGDQVWLDRKKHPY